MRDSSIVRRFLVAAAMICSLLWAVTGVSVLAIALHEHHHHGEAHDHHEAMEVVFHGHAHEGAPHHDHELTAPLSASRAAWSVHVHSMVSQVNHVVDAEIETLRDAAKASTESRDLGPPAFLLHCVLLT